jgi:hypothetical protein
MDAHIINSLIVAIGHDISKYSDFYIIEPMRNDVSALTKKSILIETTYI